ncbi:MULTISPECIES: type II toxin-antitoxin system VapB family antitoxin [unclassified Methylobacterium]|uniref:type II toxin-antitoxin system VapB family antitoxin n=1 Tax=unclassified Methylobacterium TaxID=2615210 RepID=UPI0013554687|nr:transcription factor [Methylobacterium sp. 2A]
MPLYVKDPQVDALATQLMTLLGTSKTDAVRRALQNEIVRQTGKQDLVAWTSDFVRALHQRAGPNPKPVDKAFIDRLYERG